MSRASALSTALVITLFACAQDKIGDYELSYFKEQYDIDVTDGGDFWIDCASLDAIHKEAGFRVKADDVADFKTALEAAKIKYAEWSATAKANNVTDLTKEMDIKAPKMTCYFTYGDHHFAFGHRFTFRFTIFDDGGHALVASTGKLVASDNQFMDHDGIAIVFLSTDEVDAFLKVIDPAKAIEHFTTKKEKGELFK